MSDVIPEPWASQKRALYILGAGFSAAAGLPLAEDLWKEVCRRALRMTGRAEKFSEDLDNYIEFKARAEGKILKQEDVNFEEFLGFLDIEHYLGLRGSDTWSEDGNESQVIVKTLIGQILAEKMPNANAIPQLYLEFVKKLKPWDRIITFNYDTLLEQACEAANIPFRLGSQRYTEVTEGGGMLDMSDAASDEVVILKLHGSIDWFDRKYYRQREEWAYRNGHNNSVLDDPIFNSPQNHKIKPLVEGPRFLNDPLREVYRLLDVKRFYADPPFFLATPTLITPSTAKIVYSQKFEEFWRGMGRDGGHGFRMVIIGYSLPLHDEYAHQVIYRLVTNYQDIPVERVDSRRQKEPLVMVDLCRNKTQENDLKQRYRFVDWSRAETFLSGFNCEVIARL